GDDHGGAEGSRHKKDALYERKEPLHTLFDMGPAHESEIGVGLQARRRKDVEEGRGSMEDAIDHEGGRFLDGEIVPANLAQGPISAHVLRVDVAFEVELGSLG